MTDLQLLLEETKKKHQREDVAREWMRKVNDLQDVCRKWALSNQWPQKIFIKFEDKECEVWIYIYAPPEDVRPRRANRPQCSPWSCRRGWI